MAVQTSVRAPFPEAEVESGKPPHHLPRHKPEWPSQSKCIPAGNAPIIKKKNYYLEIFFLIDTTLKPINAAGTVSANYYYETKENESLPNYLYCLALKKKKKNKKAK